MRVAIIGGGIGGLTTCLALHQRGIKATVYEAAEAFRPVGAGLLVAPNGMKVYRQLGLEQAVEDAGYRVRRAGVAKGNLEIITENDFARFDQRYDGCRNVTIHRARLHEILVKALPDGALRLGKRCQRVQADGPEASVTFADGTQATADVIVGADGLHSAVRRQLFPHIAPRYSGQTSWRGYTAFTLDGPLRDMMLEAWGGLGTRFGIVPVGHGEIYWFAVAEAPAGEQDTPGKVHADLDVRFAAYHPIVRDLIAATPVANITRTDISDLPGLPTWHRGRVVLLGDAAHATTPNLGQGGNQAIEDALSLATMLAQNAYFTDAFEKFFARRIAKTQLVIKASRRIGWIAHWRNPFLIWLRNGLFGLMPERIHARMMDKMARLVV